MKSTLKRVVSLLFLLLLSAVMMTGCIKANIDVVGGEVTAAPSSGKLRLLLEQPSAMPIAALPAKNLTLEEVNLTDDSEFVLVDISTGKRASTYIEKDPQYTSITWTGENSFTCQISVLIPYNLPAGTYQVRTYNAAVRYRTEAGTFTERELNIDSSNYNRTFTVVETIPQTGDHAAPLLWAGLLVLAGAGFVLLRHRKHA
mgnify:CR=1 FL=1